MLQLGDKKISELYLGEKKVSEVYLGEKKIRPDQVNWAPWPNTKHYFSLVGDDYYAGNRVSTHQIILPTGNWTVSLWVKANRERSGQYTGGRRDYAAMLGKYGWWNSRESFIIGVSCREKAGNKIGFWSRNTAWVEADPRSWQIEGIRAEPWVWYHALVSYNDNTKTLLFANNGNVLETRTVDQWNLWSYPITIGWVNNVWSNIQNYFEGWIREVIVEDKPRSSEEISAYYDQTKWQFWL